MLILVVLLTIFGMIRPTTSINLTYIVKKGESEILPSCIAEENTRYSAIDWIYPLPEKLEDLPNITHKFVPSLNNDFDCKFKSRDRCSKIWNIKNWQLDETTTRRFDLIFDDRWEEFPTIYTNKGSEFKERIEIPSVFKIGFSIRTSDNAELLICEGWNPQNYPCYRVNMTKTHLILHKYMNVQDEKLLQNYQAFVNILSDDEWRNFIVALDKNGTFTLIDVTLNRTVLEYKDPEPLEPLFLIVRSAEPALWKVHENQFIYTNTTQISRLGPTLNLPNQDLCISLYVSTCPYCEMTFIMMKGNQRIVLQEVKPIKDYQWEIIKLKNENVLQEKINIFIETKFSLGEIPDLKAGFWGIDDVRICHENEVKVTFLKLKTLPENDDLVSCQVIENPKWRPKKLLYPIIKDFPVVKYDANSNAINLNWTQEDQNNQINYFISYEANDICTTEPYNMKRIKSNGFLMTKHNEITIKNLVPYTKYNITFSSMLHEKEKRLYVTTTESEKPTPEELPNKVQIHVTENTAHVSWDKIDCHSIYGHIIYGITVTNVLTNVTTDRKTQTENVITINDLQPFTTHILKIVTARSFEDMEINKNTFSMLLNFTTKAGLAPAVENLEVYAIDKDLVSLRFDLPKKLAGIPTSLQIIRCNPLLFKKCKSFIIPLKRCNLWPKKYCVDIPNLIPYQKQSFRISIKNEGTGMFGNESTIEAYTMEQVPGPPSNITYKIVDCKELLDYCHLNISWHHPYNQNGSITNFNIKLNSTNGNESESIKEIMQIFNNSYSPVYEYQIKYIPYSKHYELYIQSANVKYTSPFVNLHVKTADIGDHIDQKPKIITRGPSEFSFRLAPVDNRLQSYAMIVLVQDFNFNVSVPQSIKDHPKVGGNLCHDFGNSWIAHTIEVSNKTETLEIGSGQSLDKKLSPDTNYCITFIITNRYKDTEHDVVYFEKLKTELTPPPAADTKESNAHLYALLLLLLLIPIGYFVYRRFWRKRPKPEKPAQNENVYESLPFEECEENCVNNETYDQLLHK